MTYRIPFNRPTTVPAASDAVADALSSGKLSGNGPFTHRCEAALARLTGANKEYIEKGIPHISCLLQKSLDEVIDFAEILVIGNSSTEFDNILARRRPDQIILDLVRQLPDHSAPPPNYVGICW